MADFDVKVRNLETGELLVASMGSADECCTWLAERPPNIEIVSVLSDTSPAEQRRLKESMRPYDEGELRLKEAYDRKTADALAKQYAEEMALIEGDKTPAIDPDADPNRPISVRYECDEGLQVVEDNRELTDAAKAAVLAWVAEREEWVKAKGQMIGEAHLEVYPNDVPEGETRVVEGGKFFPRLRTPVSDKN